MVEAPREASKKIGSIAAPQKQVTMAKSVMIKPQITKEYVNS
jgi:hypothetical protein